MKEIRHKRRKLERK